jgi:hypothetical protein
MAESSGWEKSLHARLSQTAKGGQEATPAGDEIAGKFFSEIFRICLQRTISPVNFWMLI